jgi:hypothetical protein
VVEYPPITENGVRSYWTHATSVLWNTPDERRAEDWNFGEPRARCLWLKLCDAWNHNGSSLSGLHCASGESKKQVTLTHSSCHSWDSKHTRAAVLIHVKVDLWGRPGLHRLACESSLLAPSRYPLTSNCLVHRHRDAFTLLSFLKHRCLELHSACHCYLGLSFHPLPEVIAGRNIDLRRTSTADTLWRRHDRRGPKGLEQLQSCRGNARRS